MTSTSQAQQEKQSRFQQYSKRMYSITLTDIPSEEYYSEYHGHKIQHLKEIVPQLKPCPVLYMAGDSSMDNKHWIDKKTKGQRPFPDPMVMDLHYHLMNELETQDLPFVPFNCAVEASTVVQHVQKEWPQDDIIRNNITSNDVLLVSIGGNDIALAPTLKTIYNMLKLIYFNSSKKLKYDTTNCFGFKYFVSLFRDQVKKYVESLISIRKPKIVMICMIYYPCEVGNGWADTSLNALQYHKQPWKLQRVIQALFNEATSKIDIPGVEIVPVPLFELLDPKNEVEYVEKVEPSVLGGEKMAKGIVKKLEFALDRLRGCDRGLDKQESYVTLK